MSPADEPVQITIDAETCTRCGRCIITCPRTLLVREGDGVRPTDSLDLCIACGHCVAVCEPGALSHSAVPEGQPDAPAEPILTDLQLELFLRSRRSIRKFKREPIDPAKLERLFDIARYAPTGKNRQAVCYTVATEDRIKQLEAVTAEFYRKLISRLESPLGRSLVGLVVGKKNLGELMWGLPDLKRDVERVERGLPTYCHDAPAVILIHGEPSTTMAEDCSFASYHIAMAAETLGLGSCWIGYITAAAARHAKVRQVAEIPDGHQLFSTIAVGVPVEAFYRLVPRNPANVRYLR